MIIKEVVLMKRKCTMSLYESGIEISLFDVISFLNKCNLTIFQMTFMSIQHKKVFKKIVVFRFDDTWSMDLPEL